MFTAPTAGAESRFFACYMQHFGAKAFLFAMCRVLWLNGLIYICMFVVALMFVEEFSALGACG